MWTFGALFLSAAMLVWLVARRPRRRDMSRTEFLATLESWLADTLSAGEWDYFECCTLSDPELEAARGRCTAISLDPVLTLNPRESWRLSPAGKSEVRRLILEIGGHSSAAA
jgi:hypothetical protein